MTGPEKERAFCEAMIGHYQARLEALTKEATPEGELEDKKWANYKPLCQDNPERCEQDHRYFDFHEPGKVKISSAFNGDFEALRYMTLRLDTDHHDLPMEVVSCDGKVTHTILRRDGGAVEIKALIYNDKAGVETLTLRRWDDSGDLPVRESFALEGEDLNNFMIFLVSAFFVRFSTDGKMAHMLSSLDKLLHEMVEAEHERAEAHDARMTAYRRRGEEALY